MNISLSKENLVMYIQNIITTNFPDNNKINNDQLYIMVERGLERTELSFSKIEAKYYTEKGIINFNHLNSDHMAVLLYFTANSGYKLDYDINLLEKLYYLNKIMNGVDIFYSVNLPEVFCLTHPLGTVLGHAKYGNFICFYQGVTVGSTKSNSYPKFGDKVILTSNSSVLGSCKIGNNVIFSANSFILNKDIPDNSIVTGQHPNNRIIPINENDDVSLKVEIIFKDNT
tara:strand:+ start:1593 stop:2276 length:684 start_codon:yes stop_codon:yes gene_type:complete